jgi:hypothetical protein
MNCIRSSSRATEITGMPNACSKAATAESDDSASSAPVRSQRSSAISTPHGVAPCARISSTDSRLAAPSVITSSTISTRPASGSPTISPPSPWSFASLRLKAKGTSSPKSASAIAVPAASVIPL